MSFNTRNANIAREMNTAKVKKTGLIVAGILGTILLGSSTVLTVEKGHTAGATVFGAVQLDKTYGEGIHFPVNPLASFTEMTTRDESIVLRGIEVVNGRAVSNGRLIVQTADKMSTGVDVEILIQIDPMKVPHFIQQAGNFNGVVSKYINPALMEALYKQGSSIRTAQDLFTPEAKDKLKDGITTDIRAYLNNPKIMKELAGGVVVKDVKVQRLVLPPQIEKLIMETKEREEAEEIAKSNERRRQTDANAGLYEKQQAAEATKANAEAEAFRRMQNAEAMEREAAAKLVVAQKEAEGIAELNKQINPQYVQYLKAQANLTAAQNYKGDVPQTVMGGDGNFVPFMNMGK